MFTDIGKNRSTSIVFENQKFKIKFELFLDCRIGVTIVSDVFLFLFFQIWTLPVENSVFLLDYLTCPIVHIHISPENILFFSFSFF